MRNHNTIYWIFQLTGWSLYCLVYSFFYLTIRTHPQRFFFEQLITHVLIGLLLTHLMRVVIQKAGILKKEIKKQILAFVLVSLCFAFLIGVSIVAIEILLHIQTEQLKPYAFMNIAVRFAFSYFHFVLLWNLIYFTYHYIEKTKQQQIDQVRLENLLKELEIKTIKAHINPHFIFNSLNSIRALVVEEPVTARSAITQLSNILRNSMQFDKTEKTLFENEFNIVKDYLSLEKLRFEERLDVVFDIEEDTLDHAVPPMILQVLVENALKYGVHEDVKGGTITIRSIYDQDWHILTVQSTGNFEQYAELEGATIISLKSRLSLLYGGSAVFYLKQLKDGLIEACVRIPA